MKDGLIALLAACNCKIWLYSEEAVFSPEPELEATGIQVKQFPSLGWCLSADNTPHYPYEKTFEEAKNDEIVILHTGGTTGTYKSPFSSKPSC